MEQTGFALVLEGRAQSQTGCWLKMYKLHLALGLVRGEAKRLVDALPLARRCFVDEPKKDDEMGFVVHTLKWLLKRKRASL